MYILHSTVTFDTAYKKIIRGNDAKEKYLQKALRLMKTDPFYPSLQTHKVNTRHFGVKWSSRATGDLRIIWDFDEKTKKVVLLLALGQHSGTHKEYK